MTSAEWKNFLSENLGVSKSVAKEIYHEVLNKITYLHWEHAFKCRMNNLEFNYSIPSGKCIDCNLQKYCYKKH